MTKEMDKGKRSLWNNDALGARTERTDGLGFGSVSLGARSGQKPEPGSHHQLEMSDEESDGVHADSSAAYTSSGDIDCEIIENIQAKKN